MNDLRDISVEIPKRLTAFTGVSGSGKNSLVVGTIVAESQRMINDSGKSVMGSVYHQAVVAHADWIIDLGPGAGHDDGRIVFEGRPADLVAARSTLTGEHLAAYVGA